MVQLSGLEAHEKPRIWAWQPFKSLDYTVLFAFITFLFDQFYVKPVSLTWYDLSVILLARCSLNRLGFQLHVDRPYYQIGVH